MDRPGVQQVPEGSGEQGKMEKTGFQIFCGAPTTLRVMGLMMMMMIITFLWVCQFIPGLMTLTMFQGYRCVRIINCKLFF